MDRFPEVPLEAISWTDLVREEVDTKDIADMSKSILRPVALSRHVETS